LHSTFGAAKFSCQIHAADVPIFAILPHGETPFNPFTTLATEKLPPGTLHLHLELVDKSFDPM